MYIWQYRHKERVIIITQEVRNGLILQHFVYLMTYINQHPVAHTVTKIHSEDVLVSTRTYLDKFIDSNRIIITFFVRFCETDCGTLESALFYDQTPNILRIIFIKTKKIKAPILLQVGHKIKLLISIFSFFENFKTFFAKSFQLPQVPKLNIRLL